MTETNPPQQKKQYQFNQQGKRDITCQRFHFQVQTRHGNGKPLYSVTIAMLQQVVTLFTLQKVKPMQKFSLIIDMAGFIMTETIHIDYEENPSPQDTQILGDGLIAYAKLKKTNQPSVPLHSSCAIKPIPFKADVMARCIMAVCISIFCGLITT